MRPKRFNLLFYYGIASSVVLATVGAVYVSINLGIHESFIGKNGLQLDETLTQIEEMKNSLDWIILSGVAILFLALTLIIVRAQKILDQEASSIQRATFLETVKSLVNAIEARDQYTKGHSLHVSRLCVLILNHSPKAVRKIVDANKLEFAGLLHDVGKIGIPESILNKQDSLSSSEWEIMKAHPDIGKQILMPIGQLEDVVEWVRHHHEKVDGSGYPSGLAGVEIPVESRIIAVADTYSALTTNRPYRDGRSHLEAVKLMNSLVGTQLDRSVMETFSAISQSELENCHGS